MVAKSYTFQESVDHLLSLGNEVTAMKLGLENIRTLLAELGDPQNNYLKVQIAGTNGKGSVCAFLDSICLEAGIRTGLYTSPHLISITERIKINGKDIDENDFARIASYVRETTKLLVEKGELEYIPTFFEQVTAIALLAFAEAKVDLAILETGLGGRLDATTAANAEIAAITRIDYDHQQYLGETIEEIAAEKAAIMHEGSKVVIGRQTPEAMAVVNSVSEELGIVSHRAEAATTGRDATVRERAKESPQMMLAHEWSLNFQTREYWYRSSSLGLLGAHQIENAEVAILVSEILNERFPISTENILNGLHNARHPGRLEFIGNILLDGAHNPGGAKALREFLDEFVDMPIVMIFGAMADKNVAEIAEILFPRAETLILTKAANSRAIDPAGLQKFVPPDFEASRVILAGTAEAALAEARKMAGDKLILVTGSLYLVGEVRALADVGTK